MKIRNIILGLVLAAFLVTGVNALAAYVNVTQHAPTDLSWDPNRIVTFNCSATPINTNITNMTLYIDDVYNTSYAKANGHNTTMYFNWTITFAADSCSGRKWSCEARTNESNRTRTTNDTIKIDATRPIVTCDFGKEWVGIHTGDYIAFSETEACGVSTRTWSNDANATTSTSFVSTDGMTSNDVDSDQWIRADYNVTVSSTDAAGLTGSGSCYIWLKLRSTTKKLTVQTGEGAEVVLTEEGIAITQAEGIDQNFLLIILIGGAFLLIYKNKGKRTKTSRRRKKKSGS